MSKDETQDRIETIRKEIRKLEEEKDQLEKDLINRETSFQKQFTVWWESDQDMEIEKWSPSHENYPYLNMLFDYMELEKYKLCDLTDLLGQEMADYVTNPEDRAPSPKDFWASHMKMDPTFLYTCIATELYKGKLKVFQNKW